MDNLVAEVKSGSRKTKEQRFDHLRHERDRTPPASPVTRTDGEVLTPLFWPPSGLQYNSDLIDPKIEEVDNQSTTVNVGNGADYRVSF